VRAARARLKLGLTFITARQLKKDAAAPFMAAARWMARSWDPWLDMTAVLRAGVFDEPADLSKVERYVLVLSEHRLHSHASSHASSAPSGAKTLSRTSGSAKPSTVVTSSFVPSSQAPQRRMRRSMLMKTARTRSMRIS
jgi:hypothetical protein